MKVQLNFNFPTSRTDGSSLSVSEIHSTEIFVSMNGGAFTSWSTLSAPSHSALHLDDTPGPRVYRGLVKDKFLQVAVVVEVSVTMPSSIPAPPNPITDFTAVVVA
jgi:hypothetical protein